MRFVSFNINGLRARIHQLDAIIKKLEPDIIGLQETKVHDDDFPVHIIKQYGYYIYYYGQKKYNGVALLFRIPPISIKYGLNNNNSVSEKRIIIAEIMTSIGILTIVNGYFPQGNNKYSDKFILKQKFYQKFQNYIERNYHNQSLLLVMGDMNIAPADLDIGIGEINKKKWLKIGKCAFLAEEKEWIKKITDWGLIDIYRSQNLDNTRYSWFSYVLNGFNKKRGLRIDLILVTQPIAYYFQHSDISYKIRNMYRPSDHAPVWADFNI